MKYERILVTCLLLAMICSILVLYRHHRGRHYTAPLPTPTAVEEATQWSMCQAWATAEAFNGNYTAGMWCNGR